MDLLQTIRLTWTQYRAFQAALAELEKYSEHELSELGITRADIPRTAYAEAERRVEALAREPPPRARCASPGSSPRLPEPERSMLNRTRSALPSGATLLS